MSARETLAQVSAATATFAGPALAAAEAGGILQEASRPFMVYVLSAGLTLIGAMFTVLMWFIKREHASITEGIKGVRIAVHDHANRVTAMQLNTDHALAELRLDVSKRMLIEEHGRSSARLHEKVNKLGRTVAFMTGKLGMTQADDDREEERDDEVSKRGG